MNFEKFNSVVLYVEDDQQLRDQFEKFLKKIFTKVIVACNGQEGLDKFKENYNSFNPIDLIITDIEMPLMDGFELLAEARKFNSDIHSIIISGVNIGPYVKQINAIDILNDYLMKPVDIDDLYGSIKKQLQSIANRKEYKTQYNLTQQYKNALDNSAIVSKTDLNGIITYVNDEFCIISKYKRKELIGKSHNIVRDPDVPKEIYENLWKTIKAKMVFKYPSLPNKAKDGSIYYVNTTVIPILDENRRIKEYISIRFDTTALEESIIAERKAKESQSIFLANMSHEIRTPLNGIMGFTNLLANVDLPNQEKEYINIINSSAQSLLNTINEILDISKIQTGKMELENIYFDPIEEFEFIKKLYEAKANEKNIELNYDIDLKSLENISLKGDITKLKQVISNLLNNAVKFTPSNGKIDFDIKIISKNDQLITLEFNVNDTGIGIDKHKQQDIFKPFIQEHQSTTREYGGTGLGLAISKDIVELMGSQLSLKSEKEKGSRFYFQIEFLYDTKDITLESKEKEICNNIYDGKVLVAEDVKINQKLIEALLKKKGLKIVFANNGLEAVNIFKTDAKQFDMVFLDINMPVMDGIEACLQINAIKSDKKIKNIPIVALTANAIKGDKERFLEYGFDDYISKPINYDLLCSILSKYLLSIGQDTQIKETVSKKADMVSIDLVANANSLEFPQEFYIELLNDFLSTVDIDLLKQYLDQKDQQYSSSQAHKLKGVSGNLKLNQLYEIFKTIELETFNCKVLDDYFNQIKNILDRLRTILES